MTTSAMKELSMYDLLIDDAKYWKILKNWNKWEDLHEIGHEQHFHLICRVYFNGFEDMSVCMSFLVAIVLNS